MPKLDEEQYKAGQQAFAGGGTIRSVVEKFIAHGTTPGIVDEASSDDAIMSFAIGFADAVLLHLRKPLHVVQPHAGDA